MVSDVESSLLGACLVGKKALGIAVEEGVRPEDFASPTHRAIYAAMLRVQERLGPSEHVDPLSVAGAMNGELEAVGGNAYLHGLVAGVLSVANTRQYARAVMEDAIERRTRGLLHEADASGLRGKALLAWLQEAVHDVARPTSEGRSMAEAYQEIYLEAEQPTRATCSYPWREIDWCTRGMRPGWLTYLAGEPGQGKTAAALEICDHLLGEGKSVLFVSLEMSPFELGVRLAQRHGFSADGLYGRSRVREEDFQALSRLIGQDRWKRLRVETVQRVEEIAAYVRHYQPDLLVLDYMQLLDIGRDTRTEGTTKNSRALKLMARRYGVPVLALSQLNRSMGEAREKRPGLWRLRDSGALEQDADAVIFVWRRPEKEEGGYSAEGEFIVGKARMGTRGKVAFVFNGERQRFVLEARR